MISKRAIDDYLARDLESFNWIKEASHKEMDEAIAQLPVEVTLKHPPFRHQKASYYIGASLSNFMYFLDMGLGKTFISLMLMSYYLQLKKIEKILVVVPNVINIEGWEEQILEHTNFDYVLLHGNKNERMELLDQHAHIYVINYDGLQTMMTELQPAKKKKKGKKVKERTPVPALVKNFTSKFQMVVFDEIHKAKNTTSLTYSLCHSISKKCEYRYGLTGTPFGRDPIDLWAQFQLIDHGETLGLKGMYQSAFFTTKKNFWGGWEHKFKKAMEEELHTTLQNRSLRYEDIECEDLPKRVHKVVPVSLSLDAITYYRDMLQQAADTKDNDVRRQENFYIKMREIASGFVYEKDEDGKKFTITFSNNEKLDALDNLIEDMPKTSKMVIFHVFNSSGEVICNHLKKKKISYAALNSTEKDTAGQLRKFKNQKTCKFLVLNIATGSTGLNLQIANYCVFYEPTDRPIWQRQAEKRVHRQGQTKRVYYYHFVTKGTVEERIRTFLKEGKDLFGALIEGKQGYKQLMGLCDSKTKP